jgi:hypothetical protein
MRVKRLFVKYVLLTSGKNGSFRRQTPRQTTLPSDLCPLTSVFRYGPNRKNKLPVGGVMVTLLLVFIAPASKANLLVNRGGEVRHSPGMTQTSTDEARRPPGTGFVVNRMSP